jgi:hypothetical protein
MKRRIPASPGPTTKIKITENIPSGKPRFTWEATEIGTKEAGSSNMPSIMLSVGNYL